MVSPVDQNWVAPFGLEIKWQTTGDKKKYLKLETSMEMNSYIFIEFSIVVFSVFVFYQY